MKHPRRKFLKFGLAAVAATTASKFAIAQTYPTRPINMIVPIAAGGNTDAAARVLAERMRGSLGQPIIIENVTGADGSIAAGRAARARPDGYTIDFGALGTHVLNGALYSLPYDVLNDFEPISPVGGVPFVVFARKTMPAKDLPELIAWLKANPNKASAAIFSPGSHLLTALFQKQTGTQFALVPYRGGAPATQDLMAGQIDLMLGGAPDQVPLMRVGSVKAYAVTSDARLVLAPEIPTFVEIGLPGLSYSAWYGLFAPKGTPKDIIGKLNSAVVEALADPAMRSRLVQLGIDIFPRDQQTPQALGVMVKAGAEKWWPIIKELGIKAQ
jgi:tripartite-type tricarboxylate transporter receptor subunit TctC